jgi:phage protein D
LPFRSPPARPAPVARRATGYAAQWAALRAAGRVQRAVVTTEQLEAARKTFRRKTQVGNFPHGGLLKIGIPQVTMVVSILIHGHP